MYTPLVLKTQNLSLQTFVSIFNDNAFVSIIPNNYNDDIQKWLEENNFILKGFYNIEYYDLKVDISNLNYEESRRFIKNNNRYQIIDPSVLNKLAILKETGVLDESLMNIKKLNNETIQAYNDVLLDDFDNYQS